MILPKGIVINTPTVYDDVARLSTVPTEKAWEYWRSESPIHQYSGNQPLAAFSVKVNIFPVYTTTHRRLEDPTARRLENFWWHVIGSDRRHLSGSALAKIYEHISVGPTFVPLRGPPNRWEGPIVC